ncbi:TnpV protein [uncultured Flavonifractor sp.]|uniref:TnpV protein n=1 Tax=uncultured Flavonifractor sp. TaxID=1193534 RepID=UPI002636C336|nr:TnpV protein [uncultured Flavonifractor sp.]
MELTYTKIGDYYYPDLCLPPVDDDRPLGKYGTLRKTYLKQHHPMMYDRLLLAGKLDGHLREIDTLATEQVGRIIADLAAKEGVNEHLKATDQLRWVGLMNSFKAAAEEQILREIVYV